MNKFEMCAVLAVCACLSGCATIIKGTSQSIVITTPPATHATCILSRGNQSWTVMTPGAVHVSKSREDILIRCTSPGFGEGSASIEADFQPWTAGNILLGGLIGITVDAADGAMNEYPRSFQVPMTSGYGGGNRPNYFEAPSTVTGGIVPAS